jgi:MscS family membrane protein
MHRFKSILSFLFIALNTLLLAKTIEFDLSVNEYSLASPRHTVWTHLSYLQNNEYRNESIAAKTLSFVGSESQKAKLSVYLKEILDFNDLFIIQDHLPDNPSYIDTITNKAIFTPFEKFPVIYLIKEGNKWLYSPETVDQIIALHQDIESSWQTKLMRSIPNIGHKKLIFGLELWQLFGLLVLILLSIVFKKIFTWIVSRFISHYVVRFGREEIAQQFIVPVAKPISLILIALCVINILPAFNIPIQINHYLLLGTKVFASIAVVMVFYKLVDLVNYFLARFAEKTESTLDDQLVPLVNKSLKIFIAIAGSLIVLQNFNVNVTALLAGLSIGGLAFALAAQDTIKNLFGSIMIFIDRPFQIGDWVVSTDFEGVIEEVGFRSTRVRTFANSLVSIPNGKLADQTIDNMGRRVFRRYNTSLGLTYDTPVELIETYVKGLKEIVKLHPHTRKDYYEIHFHSYGDFSLNILVYIFFEAPDWSEELVARHEFNLETKKLAEALGINFAFPTQTIQIEQFPGQESLSPDYKLKPQDQEEELKKYLAGFKEKYPSKS